MSSETASAGSTRPALRDSGQFRPYQIIPEPIYHTIGPVPAEPPFKVVFVISQSPKPEPEQFGITQAEHRRAERGKHLTAEHFQGDLWVLPNGYIATEDRFRRLRSWFASAVMGRDIPVVELTIDFDAFNNLMNAVRLPSGTEGAFVPPKSRFSCEPWKLCVTDARNPGYHDHIVAFGKGFFLQSVLLANPRNMAEVK